MSQNHEVEIHLPSALAEAARSIADAPLDVDAAERVRQRARALPGVEAARSRPRMGSARPVLRLTAATAAAIVISLGAWQLLGPRSAGSVLYAQVLAATKKVNTIHSVIETAGADGALVKAGELWFARGKGFAFKADGSTRIDDGKFYWEHTGSAKFASRSRSQGTDELLDQALDIKEDLKQHCQRYAAGDRVIGGVACECYSVAAPGNREAGEQADREAHTLAYISEDFLVRRVEMQKKIDGHWKMWLVRSWEYDVPVPDDVFRPAFGPGIEIVDADEAFDRVVDLRRAVFVEERAGLIFAIHRIQRFDSGGVLLVSSVRGTPETLEKFPLQRVMWQPGKYATVPPARNWNASPQGSGYFRIILAAADHQGIDAQWWIMVPRGRPIDALETEPGKFKVDMGMTPSGKFAQEHTDKNGVIQHIMWQQTIPMPPVMGPTSLVDIAENVHAELKLLGSTATTYLELGVKDVGGVPTTKHSTADEVAPAEFAASIKTAIEYWEQMDIDFQVTQGGSAAIDPQTKQLIVVPGVFLDYYQLVNDETLKRIADRRDVQRISLRHTRITDKGLAHLAPLEELQELNLAETAVGDKGLGHLVELKSLRRLDLTQTRVTASGIRKIETALPELEVTSDETKQP